MKGKIQKTYTNFSFSHQKYWVIDDTTVHLSTGETEYMHNNIMTAAIMKRESLFHWTNSRFTVFIVNAL